MFEMLAGHPPFEGENISAVFMQILRDPFPSIRERHPDVPEALAQLIERATARAPSERLASVGELLSALS